MTEIKIVYREYSCAFGQDCFCKQCLTQYGYETNCPFYSSGGYEESENGMKTAPYGDCIKAEEKFKYKSWVGKRYEVEEFEDNYDPHLSCMLVTLGKKTYECVKVVIDGKCIYNDYDDENCEQ